MTLSRRSTMISFAAFGLAFVVAKPVWLRIPWRSDRIRIAKQDYILYRGWILPSGEAEEIARDL